MKHLPQSGQLPKKNMRAKKRRGKAKLIVTGQSKSMTRAGSSLRDAAATKRLNGIGL